MPPCTGQYYLAGFNASAYAVRRRRGTGFYLNVKILSNLC